MDSISGLVPFVCAYSILISVLPGSKTKISLLDDEHRSSQKPQTDCPRLPGC